MKIRRAPTIAAASLACLSSVATAGDQCVCPWDLNVDGVVDGADLGVLLAAWGTADASDLNGDGTVDGADLGLVLSAWGPCPPPFNDVCQLPIDLGSSQSVGIGTCNIGATNSASNDIDPCGDDGLAPFHHDVWYTYVPPQDGLLTVSTCHPALSFDSTLAVYTSLLPGACACPGGQISFASLVGCDDDSCALGSLVEIPCAGGRCYTIRVGGFGEADFGEFALVVSNIFQGDRSDACHPLPPLLFQAVVGTNAGDSWDGGDESSCGILDVQDEWYCFSMPCDGTVTIDTCSPTTDFDTVLSVFTEEGSELACNDDNSESGCFLPSLVEVTATSGEVLLIRVSGFQGEVGTFGLTIDVDCTG